jgi:hypothetical protein
MFETVLSEATSAVSPGPDAAAWLAGFDPGAASSAARVEALAVTQRHAAWLASVEAGLLASFQDDAERAARSDPDDKEWISEEVGAVLRLRGDYAKNRMLTAASLIRRLLATVALLSAGSITGLDDDACARVETRVLLRAPDQSSTQFRQSLRRAVLANAPRTVEQAHEIEARTRRVVIEPGPDGMGWLMLYLPVPDLMTVKTAAWRLAQTRKNEAAHDDGAGGGGDLLPIDAYRADALVELAQRYLTQCDPTGTINRQTPAVHVVVSLTTLTGESDEPGDIIGYGPIPAALARQIAADPGGTWQRLVTDPIGHLIDYGKTRYRPPQHLADHIRSRDRTCTFPTCNRAAQPCELDHVIPWSQGGTTSADNLIPLCSRHHHLKHDANWNINHNPDTGQTKWTSPTGRTYTNHPPELPGGP